MLLKTNLKYITSLNFVKFCPKISVKNIFLTNAYKQYYIQFTEIPL